MKIPRYELARTVTIAGSDFFGRPSTLRLHPYPQPGWYVHLPGCDPVPISVDNLVPGTRSLDFVHGRARINIMEHLLALRHRVDGVMIEASDMRLPYGTLSLYLNPVMGFLRQNGTLEPKDFPDTFPLAREDRSVRWMSKSGNHGVPGLTLDITIDYPPSLLIGDEWEIRGHRIWDNARDRLEDFSHARSLGHPKCLEAFSFLASKLRWPHHETILWPRYRSMTVDKLSDIIDEVLRHRAVDILGGIGAMIFPGTYLVGTIVSHKGGHLFDQELAQALWSPYQIHSHDEF